MEDQTNVQNEEQTSRLQQPTVMCRPISVPDISTRPHLATVFEAWEVNDTYVVLIAKAGVYTHLRIRRLDDQPICEYSIFQQIKNRFIGEEVEAVQVFPKVSNYIDNTNTYHIFTWDGIRMPNLKALYCYVQACT